MLELIKSTIHMILNDSRLARAILDRPWTVDSDNNRNIGSFRLEITVNFIYNAN